ncbi:MAG: hypothetical protein ACOX8T_04215 [Bacillota bacterium]|jgi:hypothetical protein|nr:hypothetical protein [Bacillota bacterium]
MTHQAKTQTFRLFFLALIMSYAIIVVLSKQVEGSTTVKPKDEFFPDHVLGRISPVFAYPDYVSRDDFSGQITITLTVNDSYVFHIPYKKTREGTQAATTERISLRLNTQVTYSRDKNSEKVVSEVTGLKKYDLYIRPVGPQDTPYRKTEEEKISGVQTDVSGGYIIPYLQWSKELKLLSFQTNQLINGSLGWKIPTTIVERKCVTQSGGQTDHEQSRMERAFNLFLPSAGLSGSRWSRAVKDANMNSYIPEGWVETSSAHGNTNGSFTLPVYSYDMFYWYPEGFFRGNGDNPGKAPKGISEIIWRGNVTVTWALGAVAPKTKMTLEPAEINEYESWIPAPIDDERFGSSRALAFVAKIQAKDGEKPAAPGRIHFWLTDVSQEKGICTNFPLDGKADNDLRFAEKQDNIIIDPNNPNHAYTKEPCTMAQVIVEGLDTGAYGKLQATCEEQGLVAVDERTCAHAISIPMDDNQNKVADAWERAMGIYKYNYSPTDDEDNQPAKQRRNGDGYTLYEEYRGFMTLNGFVRTNPLQKDLFVHDPDRVVKEWYEPYNPAQLKLHYIDEKMMKYNGVAKDPTNRWVNFNSSEKLWYARQYALNVALWTTTDKTVGEAKWVEQDSGDLYYMFEQPLKTIYLVRIAPKGLEKLLSGIGNPSVRNDVYTKMLRSVTIHEIGHGLGIHHHIDDRMGEETEESVVSGVFDCAMRYTTKAEEKHPELLKDQNLYCRAGQMWKRAEDGKFIDYPAHDCFGQIDIKSDP